MALHDFAENHSLLFQNNKNETVVMIDLKSQFAPKEIADIAKPKVQKVPEKASVQAKYNSSVAEETVATNAKTNQMEQMLSSAPTLIKPQQSLQDELKQIQMEQKINERQKYANLYESQSQNSSWQTPISSLVPSGSDDFLPSYKIGNRTYLNALANPNIFYFVELKRKFRLAFNPEAVLRFNLDKIRGGQISVIWGVSVDARGQLKDLVLIRSSGLSGYDQEAKRTISTSAPFSGPPAPLLDQQEGLLNMAWTFVVHL